MDSSDRIIIQKSRNELLTSSIQREMNRPEYTGESSFIPRMVRILMRAYDFRDLRNIAHPITEKAVYNEAVSIWNKLNRKDEI
ncbi:hypothetical protein [Bacteroides sp.]